MTRRAVLVAVWLCLLPLQVWAATCTRTASSNAQADVQTTINDASDGVGEVVCVPNGSATWTGQLTISKSLTLQPTPGGTVVITNNNTTSDLIEITESTAGSIRLGGASASESFEFLPGTGPASNGEFFIDVNGTVNGKPVLITNNKWTNLNSNQNAMRFGTNRGVVSGNTATGVVGGGGCLNNAGFIRHNVGVSPSWTTTAKWGTQDAAGDQALYAEGNSLNDVFEGFDLDVGARMVIRYNTITNSGTLIHGDTGISGRYFEVYSNTFVWDTTVKCAPDLPSGVNSLLFFRGGTGLIHSNVIPDVTSQAWGNKSEISFRVQNLRRNAGPYPCWDGDGGWPAPYQFGWGYTVGGTQAGSTGVFQDQEPTYLWNNTGAGNYDSPDVSNYAPDECGGGPDVSTYVQQNREFYLSTAKPGYASFCYPHPLLTGTPCGDTKRVLRLRLR